LEWLKGWPDAVLAAAAATGVGFLRAKEKYPESIDLALLRNGIRPAKPLILHGRRSLLSRLILRHSSGIARAPLCDHGRSAGSDLR
jgi:hypothetical protein